jgi:hypothetical protein
MNRCKNTGIEHRKSFLSLEESEKLRKKVDLYIDGKIAEFNATVPFANHFEGSAVHRDYYKRHLIETALRIRLLRVSESKAQAEMAKISPEAAQIWANYESEEMIHDKLFLDDLRRMGVEGAIALQTEPYLSTKLLTGFFSYLLDHEGPLGVVAYSYLVEYVNVKIDPKKIEGMKASLGEDKIKGQISHAKTDLTDDHPGEVWAAIRHLITSEDDIRNLYRYFDEHQRILVMYFNEIYSDMVLNNKNDQPKVAG